METIVRSPVDTRSMSPDIYYFARNKETARTVVAFPTKTYKTALCTKENNIVLLFGCEERPNDILWISENAFYENYTVIGKVNKMIFE